MEEPNTFPSILPTLLLYKPPNHSFKTQIENTQKTMLQPVLTHQPKAPIAYIHDRNSPFSQPLHQSSVIQILFNIDPTEEGTPLSTTQRHATTIPVTSPE